MSAVHSKYGEQAFFYCSHLFQGKHGEWAFADARLVQRTRLIHDDLAILKQPVTCWNGNAPMLERAINLGCERQRDNHRRSNLRQFIGLNDENRTDFPDFLAPPGIEIGNPYFAA